MEVNLEIFSVVYLAASLNFKHLQAMGTGHVQPNNMFMNGIVILF